MVLRKFWHLQGPAAKIAPYDSMWLLGYSRVTIGNILSDSQVGHGPPCSELKKFCLKIPISKDHTFPWVCGYQEWKTCVF